MAHDPKTFELAVTLMGVALMTPSTIPPAARVKDRLSGEYRMAEADAEAAANYALQRYLDANE